MIEIVHSDQNVKYHYQESFGRLIQEDSQRFKEKKKQNSYLEYSKLN